MAEKTFHLTAPFEPTGDQPAAIEALTRKILAGGKHSTLLGVTGSGKTFTMAAVAAALKRPTLVIAHNKTLAAQLYSEFRQFFPGNAVEYFVSYYDYYQPEAYVPASDTYIEKEATINEEIDRLRLSATRSLRERRDVLIVASVSCIYGLGEPESYYGMTQPLHVGETQDRQKLLRRFVDMLYTRTPSVLERGRFRVRGDVIEVYPSYAEEVYRIDLFGDQVEQLLRVDPLTGEILEEMERLTIYPRTHYATPREQVVAAVESIKAELQARLAELEGQGRLLEAQRLAQRTQFDIEMMLEIGYCNGVENYSRHLTGRAPGEPPPTLIEYLPTDALIFLDESHMTVPQLQAMYRGDRSRKETLVEYGFRLPCALDNRPLKFEEFMGMAPQIVYVSATPAAYEVKAAGGITAEQVVRPTGLMDPEIEVRPATGQVEDLYRECTEVTARGQRVLVTTMTKKMAEELTRYLKELGLKVGYLHSDVETLERVRILRDLRRGEIEVLVGVNLLREGLDLPEVSRVAVLDADKEGFLRSRGALIQTMGRAARNVEGRAILYADRVTEAMRQALEETSRRRGRQAAYNKEHGITPQSIVKNIETILSSVFEMDYYGVPGVAEDPGDYMDAGEAARRIAALEKEMFSAAEAMRYEDAAALRDQITGLRERLVRQ
ncbi:MAG: excinuclease ABC subunit UvrB [Acidobacteriota bacterium]